MDRNHIPFDLTKALIALSVVCAYTYGLGVQTGDYNSLYEIIVDKHMVQNEKEYR